MHRVRVTANVANRLKVRAAKAPGGGHKLRGAKAEAATRGLVAPHLYAAGRRGQPQVIYMHTRGLPGTDSGGKFERKKKKRSSANIRRESGAL